MGVLPWLAFLCGVLNVIAMFGGFDVLIFPLLLGAVFLGLLGFLSPGKESPGNGRTLCLFAVIFALLPVFKPTIDHLSYLRRERIRAQQTKTTYESLETRFPEAEPPVRAFFELTGRYPMVNPSGTLLPTFDPSGKRIKLAEGREPRLPGDPFSRNDDLAVLPVGGLGAFIVSTGQDGVPDYPIDRFFVMMEADPADPLAAIAQTGVDLRTVTYDPTNGALGRGDVVRWYSASGAARDQVMRRLDESWDRVAQLTPPPSLDPKETYPPPEADARSAEKLLADGDMLGAIAAASRAVANRPAHPNFWGDPALARADRSRGLALYQLGDFRAAADRLIDYLVYQPNDPEAHYYLGASLLKGGAPKELAKRHFAAGAQLDPSAPTAGPSENAYNALDSGGTPSLPPASGLERGRGGIP